MDSFYYNAPQAYQYLDLPPTPIHTESAVSSEGYRNSPTVCAPSFHYVPPVHVEQLSLPHPEDFHANASPRYSYSPSYSHLVPHQYSPTSPVPRTPSPASFPHSPVQPSWHSQSFLTPRTPQDVYDQYQTFDFNRQFSNQNQPSVKPVAPVQQHKSSSVSNGVDHAGVSNGYEVNKFESSSYVATETAQDDGRISGQQGSNSDDDDMTPAQSRRKAQNRAAQRAFRERKERHVKDLETKLLHLENASKNLMTENERLKLQLQKASTENEILKATAGSQRRSPTPPITSGPMAYSPTDFYTELLKTHDNKTPSHRVVFGDDGGKLLAAGAAWDYIIAHPLFLQGMVDVGDVSERLKTLARCDGQGPVFAESDILRAMEASVASGSDELL